MPRPIVATIDRTALAHNLALVRENARGTRIWAVMKADAYGHGIKAAADAFADADGLALIEIENAIRLRELGWNTRCLAPSLAPYLWWPAADDAVPASPLVWHYNPIAFMQRYWQLFPRPAEATPTPAPTNSSTTRTTSP